MLSEWDQQQKERDSWLSLWKTLVVSLKIKTCNYHMTLQFYSLTVIQEKLSDTSDHSTLTGINPN